MFLFRAAFSLDWLCNTSVFLAVTGVQPNVSLRYSCAILQSNSVAFDTEVMLIHNDRRVSDSWFWCYILSHSPRFCKFSADYVHIKRVRDVAAKSEAEDLHQRMNELHSQLDDKTQVCLHSNCGHVVSHLLVNFFFLLNGRKITTCTCKSVKTFW